MPRAIALRSDFGAVESRCLARRSRDAPQARSLLALAAIYDGGTRSEAARLGNVTLQIVRDWVVCFNAAATDGLRDRKAPGPNAAYDASAPPGACRAYRLRPDPSDSRCGALASVPSRPMAVEGVLDLGFDADAEP